jgi:hypothetical protein
MLQEKAHSLSDDYYAIGAEINHLSELIKAAEIPQASNFYKRLADMIFREGDFTLYQGEVMHAKVATWFKYQMTEARTFKEATWLRNESIQRYHIQKEDLAKRKEKLFRSKN